jgi:hypothetical protein
MESLHERTGAASGAAIDDAPGYRRRIRLVPAAKSILALLEDDIHSMAVRLHHDGTHVTAVEPLLDRMPWTTCPGAAAVLVETFAGLPLREVTQRRARKANCTHLHDLAVLAAAHAHDAHETCFDIAASDPVAGRRELILRRDGVVMLHWSEQDGLLVDPPELAGRSLLTLRDAIAALDAEFVEAARLLQWGAIVAHGRTIPIERQNVAAQMAPNCHTFQPEQAAVAQRVGRIIDFSAEPRMPGDTFGRELGLATC